MKRLTYFENGHWRLDFNGCQYRADFVDRLAAYEDTGLTPEQCETAKTLIESVFSDDLSKLERIRELLKADKDGRIVILPAKTVYELVVDAGPSCDMKCPPELFTDDYGCPCCDFCDKGEIIVHGRDCRQDDVRQIGNTVWLTREEAEAEIKARRGEKEGEQ